MNKIEGSLSPNNQVILQKHIVDYEKKLNPIEVQTSSVWNTIWDNIPGSQAVGRYLGWGAAQTHGAEISNALITMVFNNCFPEQIKEKELTIRERCYNSLVGIAKPTAEEASKFLITPKILPYVTMFCSSAGGIALPVAALLVKALYDKVLGDPNSKFTPKNVPSLENLLTAKDGDIIDANGNTLNQQDITDIKNLVNKCNLAYQLLTSTKSEVDILMNKYLKFGEDDNQILYSNGEVVNETDLKEIKISINRLRGANPTHENLNKMIDLLAEHLPEILEEVTVDEPVEASVVNLANENHEKVEIQDEDSQEPFTLQWPTADSNKIKEEDSILTNPSGAFKLNWEMFDEASSTTKVDQPVKSEQEPEKTDSSGMVYTKKSVSMKKTES